MTMRINAIRDTFANPNGDIVYPTALATYLAALEARIEKLEKPNIIEKLVREVNEEQSEKISYPPHVHDFRVMRTCAVYHLDGNCPNQYSRECYCGAIEK